MTPIDRRDRLVARARQGYRLAFPSKGSEPSRFFAAPGRVNLMGEHLDYNQGYVLPCAINRETIVAGSVPSGEDGYLEVVATDFGRAREKIALFEPIALVEDGWRNLVRGVVAALQELGHEVAPARLSIAGDVPIGAGLSSSASFAVAVTLALCKLSQIKVTPGDMALIAHHAETQFLGTQCGVMDQMASTRSTTGSAMLLDCRSLEKMSIPVDKNLAVVIIDSGVRRELAEGAFNTRRTECELAANHLGLDALRDASVDALEAAREGFDPTLFKRARHVVSEMARIEPMAVALSQGDIAALARVMKESHNSLRDDFEVTVPPVDALAQVIEAALEAGGEPLGGVRMTGAGFGGCLVAVVHQSATARVIKAVEQDYNSQADIPASADVYTMAGRAKEIEVE